MKNPVAKNLKINRPATHIDKKREAKKQGFSEDDIIEPQEFFEALARGYKTIDTVRIFEDLPNVVREGERD